MSSLPPPLPPPQPVPKKGLSGCAIAAIVVGVLIGLVVIALGVGGYVFVKQAGGRSGVAKAAIGMANPDYEIIDLDDKEKTVTVRHKKTGKTATFPITHMKNGHIDPADLGMSRDESEGTGGAPAWVKYPDARQMQAVQLLSITTLIYETDDPVEKVIEYYKSETGSKGIQATLEKSGAIVVSDAKGDLKISVTEGRGKSTLITIAYHAK